MTKYYRANPYLGCKYEITKKQALQKINSKWWTAVWDDYWDRFCEDAWYDIRDPERSWIFKQQEIPTSERSVGGGMNCVR